jgi:hypothetical protein
MLEFAQARSLELTSLQMSKEVWEEDRDLQFRIYHSHRHFLDVKFEILDFGRSAEGMKQAEQRQALDPKHFDEDANFNNLRRISAKAWRGVLDWGRCYF